MDFWSIAGNIVASIIVGIAVFFAGRWKGWWGRATRRGKLRAGVGAVVLTVAALATFYAATRPPAPLRAAKFAILVADLDGDTDKTQTRHVVQTLRTQFAGAIERRDLQVLTRGEALRLPRVTSWRPKFLCKTKARPGSGAKRGRAHLGRGGRAG